MKVLVTGASGFIGQKLVPRLVEAGYSVRTFGRTKNKPQVFDKLPIEHVTGDIADEQAVKKAVEGMDIVFHMAGLVSYRKSDKKKQYNINVLGTRYVMEAALQAGCRRVIHTSSVAALGIPEPGTIGDETIVYNLDGLGLNYCDTKHQAELEVLASYKKGLEVIMLCPGIIFGEGDTHPHHHAIYAALLKGRLLGWPPGGVTFSDIEDVVATHINALTMGRSGERYVVGSACLSYREGALVLSKVLGSPSPKFRVPGFALELAGTLCEFFLPLIGKRPPLTRQVAWLAQQNIFFSSQKAIDELGLVQTPFEQTIARTAWYYLATMQGLGKSNQKEKVKRSKSATGREESAEVTELPEIKLDAR